MNVSFKGRNHTIDDLLTNPSQETIDLMRELEGDLMIIGVGGKMGPSLAKMAKRAIDFENLQKKVIGVSRFSDQKKKKELEDHGVETIVADLLDDEEVKNLPDIRNIIFMAGQKFGTQLHSYHTWAINTITPATIAEKFKKSRIVVFSSGNIYPMTSIHGGGAREETEPSPIGEYAQSVLGRERVFEYFSHKNQTPMLFFRLNYAIDVRYGVLVDIARAVKEGEPIDLTTGNVNVIWQGDANDRALRSLIFTSVPPKILNITGPETISVRWIAEEFGKRFGIKPQFQGNESQEALLNNASYSNKLFGYPQVTIHHMIEWVAQWLTERRELWDKPTHFQERRGRF
ncbi:NAD dependent epimerase/dehydratase family protein [[Clostridium] ultunense Esp]|nr:NAD dependent epimerase/dehydratase family protein [[Clostridium] ultunense Esp]